MRARLEESARRIYCQLGGKGRGKTLAIPQLTKQKIHHNEKKVNSILWITLLLNENAQKKTLEQDLEKYRNVNARWVVNNFFRAGKKLLQTQRATH